MEEQSHKDEMRAALRGDFERMRQRHVGAGPVPPEPAKPSAPPAEATGVEPESVIADSPTGSWLDRILGRA